MASKPKNQCEKWQAETLNAWLLGQKVFPSQSEEGAICGYRKNHLQEGFCKRCLVMWLAASTG